MTKAVIYARVSSKEQEKEGFSIPAQLKLLQEYADRQGVEVVETFTDAETAKKAGRTQFLAMMDFVRKNKHVDLILVEKTDRLTRNFQDYVLIDDLIQKRDIEVHMVKEGEILSQRAKSHTKLIHGIKVVLAKNFIDNLSEETSKGMMEKAKQGYWPTKAPYGYRNIKQTRMIEVDEQKAPYVKQAFALFATGQYTLDRLSQKLQDDGFRFRPSTPKAAAGSMHHILTNRFYTGHFVYKGVQRIGHHAALISTETYNEVQRQLRKGTKPNYDKQTIAFRGLMTCGYCGCTITGDVKQKGRYTYYRCTHFKQKCPDRSIREEALQEQFIEIVRAFGVTQEQHQWMVEGLKEINQIKDEELQERQTFLNAEIQRLNGRLSQLYEDKLDGVIDTAFYQRKAKEGQGRLEELEVQLHRLQEAGQKQMALGLQILEFARDASPLFSSVSAYEQARLLHLVVSNCVLKAGKLEVVYKKPFDVLAQTPENEKWYPQGNSNPCRLREREVS